MQKKLLLSFSLFHFSNQQGCVQKQLLNRIKGFSLKQWCCPQSDTKAIYCLIVPVFAKAHGICQQSLDTSPG